MKVQKTVGQLTVEFEAETQREIAKQLSSLEEVFGEASCGKCGSLDVRWLVRDHEGNEYYELRCQNQGCRARLSYGIHKQGGGLFPKRKDKEGNWLPDKGWQKWNPTTKRAE